MTTIVTRTRKHEPNLCTRGRLRDAKRDALLFAAHAYAEEAAAGPVAPETLHALTAAAREFNAAVKSARRRGDEP